MRFILKSFILLFVFCIAFFVTTIVSDFLDQKSGYYDEGRKEAASISRNMFFKWGN